MKDILEPLEKLEKVEISPFLLTRIKERIKQQNFYITKKEALTLAIPSMLVLIITVFLYFNYQHKKTEKNEMMSLIKVMDLNTNNSIY